jgi:multiple sugar transport system ATP-binding protein
VTFGVRPEHITLRADAGVKLADVTVDLVEQLGGATMLYATTSDNQPLTIAMDGQQQVALGSKATAYVDPARTHIFGTDGRAF